MPLPDRSRPDSHLSLREIEPETGTGLVLEADDQTFAEIVALCAAEGHVDLDAFVSEILRRAIARAQADPDALAPAAAPGAEPGDM